jgi:hypothetical protein
LCNPQRPKLKKKVKQKFIGREKNLFCPPMSISQKIGFGKSLSSIHDEQFSTHRVYAYDPSPPFKEKG